MKPRSFDKYVAKRLTKAEIVEIDKQVKLEKAILDALRQGITTAVGRYMKKNDIGFNELVDRLDTSASQVTKIQKGTANLTLSSLAHLFATIGEEPKLVFKKR